MFCQGKFIIRLNRNFICGSSGEEKVSPNWLNYHHSTEHLGGLGQCKSKERDIALLVKLGWRLRNCTSSSWLNCFKAKYGLQMLKRQNSWCIKILPLGPPVLKKRMRKVITTGRNTSFLMQNWNDPVPSETVSLDHSRCVWRDGRKMDRKE